MSPFFGRRKASPMQLVPTKNCQFERDEDGNVVLLKPRFGWGPLKRLLMPRLPNPYVRITLDQIGTYVWERLDGKTPLSVLAQDLAEHFADPKTSIRLPDAENRLWIFVRQLHRHGLVTLARQEPSESPDSDAGNDAGQEDGAPPPPPERNHEQGRA